MGRVFVRIPDFSKTLVLTMIHKAIAMGMTSWYSGRTSMCE